MPRKPPMPCGPYFCPAALRMLWPVKAIRVAGIGAIYGCGISEIERRAHKQGIFDQRPHRRVMVYSPAAFRAAWADPDLTMEAIAERFGMLYEICSLHARRLGLPPRRGGAPRAVFGPGFDTIWRAGVKTAVMATLYRCHPDTVLREAARRKLKNRRKGEARLGADDLAALILRSGLRVLAEETTEALKLSDLVDVVRKRGAPVDRLAA